MKRKQTAFGRILWWSGLLLLLLSPALALAADTPAAKPDSERILAAAREIMGAQTYCALITLGPGGGPAVRTMNPFPPEPDMAVWFATNTDSRKVQEIRRNPQVCLYYADHAKATGYVSLKGRAVLVNDPQEIQKRWRAYWDKAFPDRKKLVLIKVVPERIEVVNYKHGFSGDPQTWLPASVDLK